MNYAEISRRNNAFSPELQRHKEGQLSTMHSYEKKQARQVFICHQKRYRYGSMEMSQLRLRSERGE
jgi:hypothetical protein